MQYVAAKLKAAGGHAQFEDGSTSVEAGLLLMNERMQTGRFKGLRAPDRVVRRFRLYHRQDGKVVKKRDDLMQGATRYGVMSLRHADGRRPRRAPRPAACLGPYDR